MEGSLIKTYVLDTSVLVHHPDCLSQFQENEIVIPIAVIEELDNLKVRPDIVGANSRQVAKRIDYLNRNGDIQTGVFVNEKGGKLRIELNHQTLSILPIPLRTEKNDHRILAVALSLQNDRDNNSAKPPVVLVSKDVNLRLKGSAMGLQTQDYRNDRVEVDTLYSGVCHLYVDEATVAQCLSIGYIPLNLLRYLSEAEYLNGSDRELSQSHPPLCENQYCLLEALTSTSKMPVLAYAQMVGEYLMALTTYNPWVKRPIWDIQPRNAEQIFALDALLNQQTDLVIIAGEQGSWKTLLTLAAALKQTVDDNDYEGIIYTRPTITLGKDLGYLPGDKFDKIREYMGGAYDAMGYIFKKRSHRDSTESIVEQFRARGQLEFEAIAYLRGRTFVNKILVIDEAQNSTPHEMSVFVKRAGTGTKVVVLGDPNQIDTPYLGRESNGITYLMEKFMGDTTCAIITLNECVRSRLANRAIALGL